MRRLSKIALLHHSCGQPLVIEIVFAVVAIGLAGVAWTNLPCKFNGRQVMPSEAEVIAFLRALDGTDHAPAERYSVTGISAGRHPTAPASAASSAPPRSSATTLARVLPAAPGIDQVGPTLATCDAAARRTQPCCRPSARNGYFGRVIMYKRMCAKEVHFSRSNIHML